MLPWLFQLRNLMPSDVAGTFCFVYVSEIYAVNSVIASLFISYNVWPKQEHVESHLLLHFEQKDPNQMAPQHYNS